MKTVICVLVLSLVLYVVSFVALMNLPIKETFIEAGKEVKDIVHEIEKYKPEEKDLTQ